MTQIVRMTDLVRMQLRRERQAFSEISPCVEMTMHHSQFTIHHQYSIFLSDGAFIQVTTTIAIVIQPPKTTDGTTPISLAARPLSNWPSAGAVPIPNNAG